MREKERGRQRGRNRQTATSQGALMCFVGHVHIPAHLRNKRTAMGLRCWGDEKKQEEGNNRENLRSALHGN